MMGFTWFWLVAIMIVGYVVLDGFDLPRQHRPRLGWQ